MERHDEGPSLATRCFGCKGTGKVEKPRCFMSFETGEGCTLSEWVNCPYCRDNPGRRSTLHPLV